MLLLALAAALAVAGVYVRDAASQEATEPVPLERAYAHNDYEHERPLYDALDHGFESMEADIRLNDGDLVVSHHEPRLPTTAPQELGNEKGFRGWSGGARSEFTISRSGATPGYIPGEIEPGDWNIIFGTGAPGYSVGASFEEEAAIMDALGAEKAVNRDGGGSTTMTIGQELVTDPSDPTGERPIGDAVVLLR